MQVVAPSVAAAVTENWAFAENRGTLFAARSINSDSDCAPVEPGRSPVQHVSVRSNLAPTRRHDTVASRRLVVLHRAARNEGTLRQGYDNYPSATFAPTGLAVARQGAGQVSWDCRIRGT